MNLIHINLIQHAYQTDGNKSYIYQPKLLLRGSYPINSLNKKIKNKSSFKINSIFRLIKLPSKIGYFQHAPCKTYYRERSYHPKPTIKPEPPLGT